MDDNRTMPYENKDDDTTDQTDDTGKEFTNISFWYINFISQARNKVQDIS